MTDKLKDINKGDRVRVTFEGEIATCRHNYFNVMLDGGRTKSGFVSDEINAPTFSIEKLATPLAVGDRVQVRGDFRTGSILAFDGEAAVIRWEQEEGGRFYGGVPTTMLVRA